VILAPRAGTTPETVAVHCRKRLPPFKAPEEVILLRAMPHNSAGKIIKPQLKQMIEHRPAAPGAQPTAVPGRPAFH
jgi:acyl-CoA synthetase (AMP-forming)/AMP-acid ligase II